MGFDRGTPSSKKLVCGSTPKNLKMDYDEEEMGLVKRGSTSSSEQSSTPIGMRIVVSLPEEEMPSPGDSSAEEEAEDSDCDDFEEVKQLSKVTEEVEEADVAVSPSPGLSLSVVLGEEADDLSPRSISMLEAEEGREGKQGMEKLLLERLLARKELRLAAMQEKVEMQTRRLREAETRLALLETIPGFFFFQWLGLLLLRLMMVLRKASRVNYFLLKLCKLNRLVFSPFSVFFKYPKMISTGNKIAEEEEEKNTKAMESIVEEALSLQGLASNCSPGVMIRRMNPRNRSLGL